MSEAFIKMGNSKSSGASTGTAPRGKQVIAAKLEYGLKTGVLNLAGQRLKPGGNSAIWIKLSSAAMIEKLRGLDISGNELKAIPVEVYGLVGLKGLTATKCGLHYTLPMENLTRLTQLRLDHNNLEEQNLGTMPPELKELDLSYNHFHSMPPSLLSLGKTLKVLNLSFNQLTSLDGVQVLVSLIELNLESNLLTALPESMGQLISLQKLSVANNRLEPKVPSNTSSSSKSGSSTDIAATQQERGTQESPMTPECVCEWRQSIPRALFEDTALTSLDLTGNAALTKDVVIAFEGVDAYEARWKAIKDRNFSGGAMMDSALFGALK